MTPPVPRELRDVLPDPVVVVPESKVQGQEPQHGERMVLSPSGVQRNFDAIAAQVRAVPAYVGELRMYAGSTAPPGWLICSGQSLAVSDYPTLFAVIGYTYGGAGANFNIPHFHEKFPIGASPGLPGGSTGGTATHTLTVGEMPSHSHSIQRSANQADTGGAGGIYELHSSSGTAYANTQSAGGGGAHNNMPPYLAINIMIKV